MLHAKDHLIKIVNWDEGAHVMGLVLEFSGLLWGVKRNNVKFGKLNNTFGSCLRILSRGVRTRAVCPLLSFSLLRPTTLTILSPAAVMRAVRIQPRSLPLSLSLSLTTASYLGKIPRGDFFIFYFLFFTI